MKSIHDIEVDDYLYECVTVFPEAIQEEMVRTPVDLAYWGEQHGRAMEAWKMAKLTREKVEAELFLELQESIQEETKKKPTLDTIKASVVTHPKYDAAKLNEIEAEARYQTMKNRLSAVAAKKDMIQSIGAQLRAEMAADPSVAEDIRTRKGDDF